MEKEFMVLLSKMDFMEILGFAKLMNVDKDLIKRSYTLAAAGISDVEDLVCETVLHFSEIGRKRRRVIMKLARQTIARSEQQWQEKDV